MDLFTLKATLGLDTTDYDESVKQAKEDAEGLKTALEGVDSETTTAGKKADTVMAGASVKTIATGNLAAEVAKKALAVATNVFTTGIKYNSDMDAMQKQFSLMLGSEDMAEETIGALEKSAAKTPYELLDLTGAATQLSAYGVENEKLVDTVLRLGDMARGDVNRLSSLANVYGQVSSLGYMLGQDRLQFINAGYNPYQTISQHTGIDVGDLMKFSETGKASDEMAAVMATATQEVEQMGEAASGWSKVLAEMQESGKIGFSAIEQAIVTETSEGGRFYGQAEAASQTFEGQMSTLTDNAKKAAGGITEGFYSVMTNTILPGLNDMLSVMNGETDFQTLQLENLKTEIEQLASYQEMMEDVDPENKTGWKEFVDQQAPVIEEKYKKMMESMATDADASMTDMETGAIDSMTAISTAVTDSAATGNEAGNSAAAGMEALMGVSATTSGSMISDAYAVAAAWQYAGSQIGGASPGLAGRMAFAAGSGEPSKATGLDYVPYDEFRARLHMGEAVLNRQEAEAWRSGSGSSVDINALGDVIERAIARGMASVAVNMDGQRVGTLVTPTVSRAIAREAYNRRYGI